MQRHFEIRAADDRISGVVMEYGAVATLPDGSKEQFAPRSIQTLPPVAVYVDHIPGSAIATERTGLTLADSDERMTFDLRMPEIRSTDMDDAFQKAKAGVYGFVSVTFADVKSRMENGVNIIEKALVPAFSLTAHPAYSSSHLHRSQAASAPLDAPLRYRSGLPVYEGILGELELRQGMGFSGFVKYGVVGILGMNPPRYQLLQRGSLASVENVVLLAGGYDSILAASAAKSLLFRSTDDGVSFLTRGRLARTQHLRDTSERVRGKLLTGVRPGLVNKTSTMEAYKDGTLETVTKADVCDFRMVVGDSFGALATGRPRRRRNR